MRTVTQRGLRWIVLALVLALAGEAVSFASMLAFWSGPYIYAQTTLLFSAAFTSLLFACAVPAFLGYRCLRLGRDEFGPSHRAHLKLGVGAFLVGGGAAAAFMLTGIFLGFFYIPAGAYVSGTTYSSPLGLALGETVRAVHVAAPSLIAVFLGLFLLESVWQLATRTRRILAMAAFVMGVLVPVSVVPPVGTVVFALVGTAYGFLPLVSAASLALWIIVLLLVGHGLERAAPASLPAAFENHARGPAPSEKPPAQPAAP